MKEKNIDKFEEFLCNLIDKIDWDALEEEFKVSEIENLKLLKMNGRNESWYDFLVKPILDHIKVEKLAKQDREKIRKKLINKKCPICNNTLLWHDTWHVSQNVKGYNVQLFCEKCDMIYCISSDCVSVYSKAAEDETKSWVGPISFYVKDIEWHSVGTLDVALLDDQVYDMGWRCIGKAWNYGFKPKIIDKHGVYSATYERSWIWRKGDKFILWINVGNGHGWFDRYLKPEEITLEIKAEKGYEKDD